MLVAELLKCTVETDAKVTAGRIAGAISAATDREFRWALEAGLGPLLHHYCGQHFNSLVTPRREVLLGATLGARVLHSARLLVAGELLAHAGSLAIPLVLLKGMSTAMQLYPEGHMRRMTDIDILIPPDCYQVFESLLIKNAFRRGPGQFPLSMNHGVPLYHCTLGVRVEIHRRLFSLSSDYCDCTLFDSAELIGRAVDAPGFDYPALRLPSEHELLYAASVLFKDLAVEGLHPTLLPTLFDVTYLAHRVRNSRRWQEISTRIDNAFVGTAAYCAIALLRRLGINTVPDTSGLGTENRLVGRVGLRAIQEMLSRCLIGGRTWMLPVPIPVPGRYSLHRQLSKRFRRLG
jgi:hypothetical protein